MSGDSVAGMREGSLVENEHPTPHGNNVQQEEQPEHTREQKREEQGDATKVESFEESGLAKGDKDNDKHGGASPDNAETEAQKRIGYRTFQNGRECYDYYHTLLMKYRKHQNLNEYEHHNLLQLIEKGHPDAMRKLSGGVSAFQIREVYVNGRPSPCFHIIREDGSVEDVSYRKCVATLYPDVKPFILSRKSRHNDR